MKILIIGFLAFSGWSATSTYYYVCKIRGLCNEPVTLQVGKEVSSNDSLGKTSIWEQSEFPKDLNIYFAFDKSEFNSNAETEKYFNDSKTFLDRYSQTSLNITGYADSIGTEEYNQALGYRRAQSISTYLESKGLPANRMVVKSKGENEPADGNNTATGRANNRRTAVTFKK
jgi:OOP family OmpA-OmpF porin